MTSPLEGSTRNKGKGGSKDKVKKGRTVEGLGCSSLPSKRFDMAPLCHALLLAGPPPLCLCVGSEMGTEAVVPAIYIAALPLPGRADGSRLTITEDERGMICESSLNSGDGWWRTLRSKLARDTSTTHLGLKYHRTQIDQSRSPYPSYWLE